MFKQGREVIPYIFQKSSLITVHTLVESKNRCGKAVQLELVQTRDVDEEAVMEKREDSHKILGYPRFASAVSCDVQ